MKAKTIAIAALAAAVLIPQAAYSNDALSRAEEACENYDWPQALAWFGRDPWLDPARLIASGGDRLPQ